MKTFGVIFLLAGLLSACVTINIYFPAAEAQKAADKIIEDVWQIKEGDKAKSPGTDTDKPNGATDDSAPATQ